MYDALIALLGLSDTPHYLFSLGIEKHGNVDEVKTIGCGIKKMQ